MLQGRDDCGGLPPCVHATRFQRDGTIAWQKRLMSNSEQSRIRASAVIPAIGGGYVIAGSHSPGTGPVDALLIWLDENGNIIRTQSYRIAGPGTEAITRIVALESGRYLVVSSTYASGTKLWAFEIGATGGTPVWQARYGATSGFAVGIGADLPPNGGLLLIGSTSSFQGGEQLQTWLLRTDAMGQLDFNRNPLASRVVTTVQQPGVEISVDSNSCRATDRSAPTTRNLPLTIFNVAPVVSTQAD